MQTIPTFVYFIPTLVLFGLGAVPGLISTVIFSIPAPIRLTHLGITSVPLALREAGEAFGATRRQLLFKVELPYALPTIMAGITQCIMLSLSMVVIAALVGADGLGKPVVRALELGQCVHGLRGRGRDRHPRHHPRPRVQAAGAALKCLPSSFRNVDIVFGRKTGEAIRLIDTGASRDTILAQTGCVLGAAGIDLAVQRGEICVLMGLSGSGKSTVLRAINRLNKVARGAVLVEHEAGQRVDVTQCDGWRAAPVAHAHRRHGVPAIRAAALAHGAAERGIRPGTARHAEAGAACRRRRKTGHGGSRSAWSEKYAHELSGGMQQRVGLARAFATDADILLMDEPFSALDPLIRDKLQDELLDLQARLHKTIVFVSHDLDEALKLGNRIAIMEGGRIVQFGSAEDILLRPADDYVAAFVKHMNPLNVLRGSSVMRPAAGLAREGTQVLLDQAGRLRLELDAQARPLRAQLNGSDCTLSACSLAGDTKGISQADVLTAPTDIKLRAAIALKRQTDHPIVLVDQLGRLAGLCGDEEIYMSLLSRGRK